MKALSLRIALFIFIISCCFLLSYTAFAQGTLDGQWVGTTSIGESIAFVIIDNFVRFLDYTSVYTCPTGSTSWWGHGRYTQTKADPNVGFVIYDDIEGGHIRDGGSFPSVIRGMFPTLTTASGSITAGLAAYRGVGALTQSCSFLDTWTAHKVSSITTDLESKGEYDRRLD